MVSSAQPARVCARWAAVGSGQRGRTCAAGSESGGTGGVSVVTALEPALQWTGDARESSVPKAQSRIQMQSDDRTHARAAATEPSRQRAGVGALTLPAARPAGQALPRSDFLATSCARPWGSPRDCGSSGSPHHYAHPSQRVSAEPSWPAVSLGMCALKDTRASDSRRRRVSRHLEAESDLIFRGGGHELRQLLEQFGRGNRLAVQTRHLPPPP